jgi:hypothetical protein
MTGHIGADVMARNSEVLGAMFWSLNLHLEAESSSRTGYAVANTRTWVRLAGKVVVFNGFGTIISDNVSFDRFNCEKRINAEASRGRLAI